ncbi:TonB-dependent receptor [Oceanicoccus sp. KOV_DT_Chl]|uniref:TonB-dependent receptor n=1 Tax=Oceanicoccus sp. KOV_DT_Chl TaxID=1904639 RepID=UPI001F17EBBB|nr:TonB-dependent receptor [Oceanicoccus sp. KOV_DT_Chl]
MKNLFSQACSLLLCVGPWSQTALFAESQPALEHVLVSVPLHRTEAETALPVTILTGAELQQRVAGTIGETLNYAPGLSSSSFGPAVGQPVIRGQQGARVTVLSNSTSSADASNISADHAVSVEPVLAESIEVLRGPSTLLYGGGAIGGVVNVIDQRIPVAVPEAVTGAMELRHGSVNDENTAVFKVLTGSDNIAFYVDGMYRDSNDLEISGAAHADAEHDADEVTGFIANTDAQTHAFTSGASYIFENGFIGIAVSRLKNQYGIPAGAHEHEHEDEHEDEYEEEETVRIDLEQTRYDLRADYHPQSTLIDQLRWYSTYSDYKHDELEGGEVGTRWRNDSWENRVEVLHQPVAGWHGVVGLQTKNTDFSAVGDESYIPETTIKNYGFFMVEDFHRGDWLYELGARVDYEKLSPEGEAEQSFNSVSLSASALWQISTQWSLGVALSQSERAPVVEELYSNSANMLGGYIEHVATGSIEVGDAQLQREQANNIDLTLNYKIRCDRCVLNIVL